jgi:hypothetical protein
MWLSVQKHWPQSVPFDLYSEDVLPGALTMSFPDWLYTFKERHVHNLSAQGRLHGKASTYNYRFDAVRFAHKTAAVIDAIENAEEDFIVWVDADTVTHSTVTEEFLQALSPAKNQGISWLARKQKYPECGFYIVRRALPEVQKMTDTWKGLYKRDTLFHLPEWHDSFVLQEMVRLHGVRALSISGDYEDTSHPFINGPLGGVMDHMKGPRKLRGRSAGRDLKHTRSEDYWKTP